ncbi:hypothetical protein [Treponema sp. R6D11]
MYVKIDLEKAVNGEPQPEGYFDTDSHKEAYSGEIKSSVWEEKLNELLEYLTIGKLPEGICCKSPKMSLKKAKSVIWFLQEVTKIIPDEYEVCARCGEIHDSGYGRYFETNWKFYCGDCLDYAPVAHCEECGNEAGYKKDTYSMKHEMYLCEDCRKEKDGKTPS